MEKLTEYQWEQRRHEREQWIRSQITSAELARRDRVEFDVEYGIAAWSLWPELEAKRKADGWELAWYGQFATMFTMSGYFRRKKAIPPREPESSPTNP